MIKCNGLVMVIDNSNLIGNLKVKHTMLVKQASSLINSGIWPLTNFAIGRSIEQ